MFRFESARPAFALAERNIWPGCQEIDVAGELDRAVCEALGSALERAAAERQHVLLDLSNCEFIDGAGVATLVQGHERLSAGGCQLLLFGARGQVRRMLSVTGLAGANHGIPRDPWRHPLNPRRHPLEMVA